MVKVCPNCGYSNVEEAKFCGKCGYDLQNVSVQAHHSNPNPLPSSSSVIGPKFPIKAIIGLAAIVVILIIIVGLISVFIQPNGEIITPYQVSAVTGGTWQLEGNNTFYISVNNNNVSINYFNGSKESIPISYITTDTQFPFGRGLISGQIENMEGTVNGTKATMLIYKLCYQNETYANYTFLTLSFLLGVGGHEVFNSNHTCFIDNITSKSTPESVISSVSNGKLTFVGVAGIYLNKEELLSLLNDTGI
ncbi:zinc-ribbon domain-containing protein [Sulfuracidifex metallicus]|uniref:Zinc-ribbon domain-containing protein n=2 Tax=Sulfuracidifex metallicus TaxID=47303 RepID=A0A6A9QTN9_SULME|nr:zinc ribbon domain-containing protein [Sulfuracidifex metallicus]MUN29143.1 zinc-ribbon domain-containing protein [Sulfuracidifex metallicus DSM 6482 = JCM 9184]WOE50335.1 zinc ribbon domain-containing protein [Sulfuracidifex metallicus DSM 6482 = JCM 9184]